MTQTVRIHRTENSDTAIALPAYETEGSAGMDIRANFPADMRAEGIILPAGARALIPTGMKFEIPIGYEVQIRPRSGLAHKHGVTLVNAPGTIDSDYRGEVGMILINHGNEPFSVTHGERVAQMVFAQVARCDITEVTSLTTTARGAGGFGSTGKT
ncbi:deoxyuridine 5'-triphosphate nucleotidohydrolase [Rhodobacterales bacterium 52_120_T64]|nr:deoxyuridine 5'-triphosphate nucleotidohydrolase [Rhodobacterales bacterium 52_120_T64]